MIFDAEPRLIRRPPAIRGRPDDQFNRYATAMTPTTMWLEQNYPVPRRRRRTPPIEPTFAYRAPTAITTPSAFWMEAVLPTWRKRRQLRPWFVDENWSPIGPIPPLPPPPAPPPTITQTIYASTSSFYQPAFAPPFGFIGASGQALVVGNSRGVPVAARTGTGVSLFVNLSPTMGIGTGIASAIVYLQEGGGADATPALRLYGAAAIVASGGRQRQGVRQTLVNLVSGGQYVAIIVVRLTDGSASTFSAPFLSE